MATAITAYRVFIASPGGLQRERHAFRATLQEYNETDAIHRGVQFIPVGWEETLSGMGRPQELINADVRRCDYFVLLLWDRWGTPPHRGTAGPFTAGTEEEYAVATRCLGDPDTPMAEVVVFFKAVDPAKLSDPGPQLEKVLNFRRHLEELKDTLFCTFDDVSAWQHRLRRHLSEWVREHEGRSHYHPERHSADRLSTALRSIGLQSVRHTPDIRGAVPSDTLLEAERLADQGRLTDAETLFARAAITGNDPDAFDRYGTFLRRMGRLSQADVMYERVLTLAGSELSEWRAKALGNIGLLSATRGELAKSMTTLAEALDSYRQLGNIEGMATIYEYLAVVSHRQDDLGRAMVMIDNAIRLNESLARNDGLASNYRRRGLIQRAGGDLEGAKESLERSLAMEIALGRSEGIAKSSGSLGAVLSRLHQVDRAEEYLLSALEINIKLGRLPGLVADYAGLEELYLLRGQTERATEMERSRRELEGHLQAPLHLDLWG